MLLLSSNAPTCATYPVDVDELHVVPRPGRTLVNSVYPSAVASSCTGMTGNVSAGLPAGGSYVPPGVAGLDYASPGYAAP